MPKAPGKALSLGAQVGFYTSLGFIVPGAALGGFGLGWALDRWLHTSPVFAVVLGLAGTVAGVIELLRVLTQAEKRDNRRDRSDGPGES